MKRLSLVLLLCVLCGTATYSQTYYYSTTKTITGNGFVYKCDNSVGNVTLYNAENKFTYTYERYKDGSGVEDEHLPFMINFRLNEPIVRNIISNAFTLQEKTPLKTGKAWFMIVMTISSDTGKVIEVHFEFSGNRSAGTIPVETYREIEVAVKSQITFTLAAEGRRMNFLTYGFIYSFAEDNESGGSTPPPTPPIPPASPTPASVAPVAVKYFNPNSNLTIAQWQNFEVLIKNLIQDCQTAYWFNNYLMGSNN